MISNGISTYWDIRTALGTSRWPAEKLVSHQVRQLKALLAHAYKQVPFYKQHFDRHAFHPSDFNSPCDIARIPPLEKQLLRDTLAKDFLDSRLRVDNCLVISTSGSTGSPLSMRLDSAGQRSQRVAAWRILFEHGFRWTDHTLEIRMTLGPSHPLQRLGIAPKTWLSALDTPESWVQTWNKLQPDVLVGCPSILRAFALAAPNLQHFPRLIFSDTETLYPADREFIKQRLGSNPVDIYGLVELSNFVWECEAHQGYHISADSHWVELAPTKLGNEMLVTHLDQFDMPIIRYRTGDLAHSCDTPCPCGRTLPRLQRIEGRALDSVLLPSGRTLFWIFFHEVLAVFPEIQQWRVVQASRMAITLQLVTSAEHASQIEQSVRNQLPESLELHTEVLNSIPLAPGEKFRAILRSSNL
jgi:phenylacetate-CoA ligase